MQVRSLSRQPWRRSSISGAAGPYPAGCGCKSRRLHQFRRGLRSKRGMPRQPLRQKWREMVTTRSAVTSYHLRSVAQQTTQLPHMEKIAGAIPARAPIFHPGVAEQQLRRAVNALPRRATEVQVLPPRPISFRQSVGSDVSQWYWEERSATLRAGSILCGRGETAYAPAREAGGRKPVRVQFPPSAPFSRRGWNSRHSGLKPRWTFGSVPVQPRPPRPIMRLCVEQ